MRAIKPLAFAPRRWLCDLFPRSSSAPWRPARFAVIVLRWLSLATAGRWHLQAPHQGWDWNPGSCLALIQLHALCCLRPSASPRHRPGRLGTPEGISAPFGPWHPGWMDGCWVVRRSARTHSRDTRRAGMVESWSFLPLRPANWKTPQSAESYSEWHERLGLDALTLL